MRSSWWMLPVLVSIGCAKNEVPPAEIELPEAAVFSKWPMATNGGYRVGPVAWTLCSAPAPPSKEAEDREVRAKHGPHASRSIVVRVNPDAMDAFLAGEPLPVGKVVVKEKHSQLLRIAGDLDKIAEREAEQKLDEYALMIKRDPGYFPEGGDWEYAYVTLGPEGKVSRGRLAECADCHTNRKSRDFLFRTYLKEADDQ